MNERRHNGLHINLFLADRPCLIVGGGKMVWHKTQRLLDAGAQIAVVSPEVCDELGELIEQKLVTHTVRKFKAHDIEGATLVYAATNSRSVNRQVLKACRERGILCSCVDGNWAESDFTTPATAHHNQLTLSVSSGGTNGRQAKMVKNSLARHLRMIESAHLVVVGTDHHHLNINEREPFHLTGPRLERAGFMIMQLWGTHEFMVLNTCNRVEVIAVVSKETAENGILRHILGFTQLKEDQFYLKTDHAAFEHLCLVAAGMLSQTPGENHITAQIKNALDSAKTRGWASNMVQEWISSALHVSKEIKNKVAPRQHTYEIEDLVLQYMEAQGTNLASSTLMVLGAGMLGKALIKKSLPMAEKIIWCYHVNQPERSKEWNRKVELCSFNEMKNRLADANLIISAADAPDHLLQPAHAPFFTPKRPVTIIDLGMPRNIAPELDNLSPDLSVIDLDGLKYWHRREQINMTEILSNSRAIITNHADLYKKITNR